MSNVRGDVPMDMNPSAWFRMHHKDFTLLTLFFKAHGAFPATSTSAERVFNMDGLVIQKHW